MPAPSSERSAEATAHEGHDADSQRGGRRRAESERRRQRILEAARQCFGELGFAGAKIETIAARAGVSNGLLYQFFRSKEHLFEVVAEDLFKDWRRSILCGAEDASAGASDGFADRLEHMIRGSVEFARNNPLLPALLSEDSVLELARFSDLGGRWGEGHREYVAEIVRGGVEAGEFRPDLDVESVADVICQLHVDYSTRAYRASTGQTATTPALVDAVARFVRDAVCRPS